jgi:hypothetical protein
LKAEILKELYQFIKRRLALTDLLLISVNLLAVWGVWFKGWNAKEVFLVYCLESVIVGLFNVLRMFLTTLIKKKDVWSNAGSSTMVSGYFFIIFFIVHYGFFVAIQMSIFLSVMNFKGIGKGPDVLLPFLFHFPRYLSKDAMFLLLSFVISYAFLTLKNFIFSGAYRTASLGKLMFEPYARIFIQQFVVIVGGFILVFGAGKVFILVFALVKIFFEVVIDYERIINEAARD